MNTLSYCTTAGLSIFFLIGCLIHLGENDVFSLMTIKKFQRLIYVLMSEIVLDCLFSLLEGHEVQFAILYSIKFIELSLNPVLGFLAFDIFYDKKKKREDQQNKEMARIHLMMLSFIALNGVLLALAAVGQNVFIINEANLYVRGQLMPFYLRLLTERQQEILKLYFYEDLSLTEIAENLSISRNGVYDTLKKAEKSLKEYEDKLQLSQESASRLEKYEKIRSLGHADVNKIINELIQREEEYE